MMVILYNSEAYRVKCPLLRAIFILIISSANMLFKLGHSLALLTTLEFLKNTSSRAFEIVTGSSQAPKKACQTFHF